MRRSLVCALVCTAGLACASDFPSPGWPVEHTAPLVGTWVGTGVVAGENQPVWCTAFDDPMRLECAWNMGHGTTGTETGILYQLGADAYNWARYGNNESACALFVLSGGKTLTGSLIEDRCSEPPFIQSMTIYRASQEENPNIAAPTNWILNQWRQ